MVVLNKNFKYIDLFAGIGGFHCAMEKYSPKSKCILASEIDKDARHVYKDNFGIEPVGDVRNVDGISLGKYDVICGGFPCQTFSKAGMQAGFKDPRGTLFQEIVRLASFQKRLKDRPRIIILENVRNLISHDKGDTWRTIRKALIDAGYNVIDTPIVIGPKDIGIPQLRDRAIILAVRKDIYNKPITLQIERKPINSTSIYSVVKKNVSRIDEELSRLSKHEMRVLKCWDEFYHGIDEDIIGFPVWSDEFGRKNDISHFPLWKQDFINKNRKLYKNNKEFIDSWLKKWDIRSFATATERKFEWQCGDSISSVFDGIIQFRPSGIRVKKPTEAPTLVAMNHNPIIGKYKRYITVKEAARLQSFPNSFIFDEPDAKAFKQLGNAVNVDVIEFVFSNFIEYLEEVTNE